MSSFFLQEKCSMEELYLNAVELMIHQKLDDLSKTQ
jgi:hypothetical protein